MLSFKHGIFVVFRQKQAFYIYRQDISGVKQKKIVKKIPTDENDKFLEWWSTYPSTNGFTHKGNGFYEILGKFIELCNIGDKKWISLI